MMSHPDFIDSDGFQVTPTPMEVAAILNADPFWGSVDAVDFFSVTAGEEIAGLMMQAIQDDDLERYSDLYLTAFQMRADRPNIITGIIEDGRIAYMAIGSFANYHSPHHMQESEQIVFDFYDEIRDFDHLIIDLRRNWGGFPDYFYRFVLAPNINNVVTMDAYFFTLAGGYVGYFQAHCPQCVILDSTVSADQSIGFQNVYIPYFIDATLRPVTEILEESYLPQLNMYDMERMNYGFRVQYRFTPAQLSRFDYHAAFNGMIWLLTCSESSSGGHLVAWVAKDTGFATLVGENTGGNFGGTRTFAQLPNSRISYAFDTFYVTDRYGYGIEAGIVPHHRNRPDMGALETTLALIAEGQY